MPRGSDEGTGKKRVPRERERERKRERRDEVREKKEKERERERMVGWRETPATKTRAHEKPNGRRKRRCSTAVPAYNALFPASADEIEPRAGPTSGVHVFFLQPSLFPTSVPLVRSDFTPQPGFFLRGKRDGRRLKLLADCFSDF